MYNPKTFIKPDLTEIFSTIKHMHEFIQLLGKTEEFIEYLNQKGIESKKPKKPLSESNSPVHRLYALFCNYFKEMNQIPYPGAIQKDMAIMKQILDSQGGDEDVSSDIIGIYFSDAFNGSWYKSKVSVGHLRTYLPQLVIRYQEEKNG